MASHDARGRSLRHDAAEDVKRWGHLADLSPVFVHSPRAAALPVQLPIAVTWLLPGAIAAVALVCLGGGIDSLLQHWRADVPRAYRAPSGVVLIVVALVQLGIAQTAVRGPYATHWISWPWRGLFWRWLLVGALVSYAAALALGPDAYVRYLFRASLACWYTILLLPLVARPTTAARWQNWIRSPRLRFAGRCAFAISTAAVLGEVGLRLVELAAYGTMSSPPAADACKLPPGSEYHGRQVNAQGYWDDAFELAPRPGRYRVAVLGGSQTLSGTAATNCLARLEARVPGIEIYNFGLPRSGLWQYAAQLEQEVVAFRPDLVVVLVSVGQDVTPQPAPPHAFDWRDLRTCRLAAASLGLNKGCDVFADDGRSASPDFETYLSACSRRIRVCRTPTDDEMEQRWHATRARLTDLVRRCRRRQLDIALVVAPEEFQVSPMVCQAVRRRLGYQPDQLDLELPQRRLARLAEELELPLLDLLPYFRAAGSNAFARQHDQWNDEGNQVASEAIGGWLQARFGATILAQTRRGQ